MSAVRRTNQAVYFTRTILDQAEQAIDAQQKSQLEESGLYHLYSALNGFCNELIKQYSLPPFLQLSELFEREGLPAELKELALLFEQKAWVYEVSRQYHRVLLEGFESSPANSNLITSQSDYVALFRNWLIELEKTISRMREHYQEY